MRETTTLTGRLERKLIGYATAAGTAGIGLLALSPAAEASVVYTPADVRIGGIGFIPYNLDVNNDGTADFEFLPYSYAHFDRYVVLYAVGGGVLNSAGSIQVAKDGNTYDAAVRKSGGAIGPQKKFGNYARMGAAHSDFYGHITLEQGSWLNLRRRYLGLKFKIGDETHYGWARLNVHFVITNQLIVRARLTGYAYETEPDKPIVAGDEGVAPSASLGHLALGAAGRKQPSRAYSH